MLPRPFANWPRVQTRRASHAPEGVARDFEGKICRKPLYLMLETWFPADVPVNPTIVI